MEPFAPERIYATVDIKDDAEALARVERMAAAMGEAAVEWVDEDGLCRAVGERGWEKFTRWGMTASPRDPDVVFTTAKFDSPEEMKARRERWPALALHDLWGHHTWRFRPDGTAEFKERTKGIICQSAWQLHSVNGCMYRCAYCWFGKMIRILANMERYVERLDEWLAECPSQRIFKWDNQSDVTCFEPEYGADRLFVEYFAKRPGRFLEIYVGKSANVDHLLDMDHGGQTIMQWSVAAKTQTEALEPKTANWHERVEAARKCQQAGYLIRYRFSPIIPVKNWREENAELVELIFKRTAPDVISLCPMGWMGYDVAEQCMDMDLLDPEFVAAMKAMAPFLKAREYTSGGGHPIPHDARYVLLDHIISEIQRHNPDQVIALCLETPEMWRALAARIGQDPNNYVCNCGPLSTPGGRLYDRYVGSDRPVVPA